MIIYVILVVLLIVTTMGAIMTCNSDHEKLHTVLVVACFVSFYGLLIFAGLDYYYRKNVEAVNVVATIEDKHERRIKTSKNTWTTKYSLYMTYEGEEDQKEVDKKIYDKWEIGQEIQGQKIYYTTGITNINTYEYVWAF